MFAEPAALSPSWELKLDAPLKSPSRATADYLSTILTRVLTNTGNRATSWLSQILSGAVWLQVSLLCGYKRTTVMRAMHGAVQKAYCGGPH